jgi:hypothetical protein
VDCKNVTCFSRSGWRFLKCLYVLTVWDRVFVLLTWLNGVVATETQIKQLLVYDLHRAWTSPILSSSPSLLIPSYLSISYAHFLSFLFLFFYLHIERMIVAVNEGSVLILWTFLWHHSVFEIIITNFKHFVNIGAVFPIHICKPFHCYTHSFAREHNICCATSVNVSLQTSVLAAFLQLEGRMQMANVRRTLKFIVVIVTAFLSFLFLLFYVLLLLVTRLLLFCF